MLKLSQPNFPPKSFHPHNILSKAPQNPKSRQKKKNLRRDNSEKSPNFNQKNIKKNQFSICKQKPLKFAVCEIGVFKDKFEEHFSICGNKMKNCSYCEVFVKVKRFDRHLELCGKNFAGNQESGFYGLGKEGNRRVGDEGFKGFAKRNIYGNEDCVENNDFNNISLEIKRDIGKGEKRLCDNFKKLRGNLRKAKKKKIYINENKIEKKLIKFFI